MLRALDLFCKAGGATKGLQRAGFHVTGVDIEPQPNYCGDVFVRADALSFAPIQYGARFDFIWASPPCQAHTSLRHLQDKTYPDLIALTRMLLEEAGVPWCIENVVGAPLVRPLILCGTMFGLGVRRHRHFETALPMNVLPCRHDLQPHPVDVSGTGARRLGPRLDGKGGNSRKPRNLEEAREVMGIDWMNRRELSQAIPPAYSEYIGRAAVQFIKSKAA